MDFFRKYQKPILYFAVFFALIVFSITGDVMNFFAGVFRDQLPSASIVVHDKPAELTERDYNTARAISMQQERDALVMVMPDVGSVNPEDRLTDTYAVLRRQALEEGIESSWDEVDRAIEAAARARDVDPRRIVPPGFASFESYRTAIWESLRIATLVRIETLGARPFPHDAVEKVLEDAELVTLRVAAVDGDAIEEQLEAEHTAREDGDAIVQQWLDELEETDMLRRQFAAEDRFQVDFAGIRIEEFDPAEFERELDGFEVSDDELRKFYDINRFNLYRYEVQDEPANGDKDGADGRDEDDEENDRENGPPDGQDGQKDGEDSEVEDAGDENQPDEQDTPKPKKFEFREFEEAKDDVLRRKQAERAMLAIWDEIQLGMFEHLAPLIDVRTEAFAAMNRAETAMTDAKAAFAEDPENDELEAALAAAQDAFEAARKAHETADAAVAKARNAFDPLAKFAEVTSGRTGFFTMNTGDEPLTNTGLVKLDGLGEWTNAWAVRSMTEGQVSSQVQFTKNSVFHFRIGETVKNEMKQFEEIAEDATAAYLAQQAEKRVSEAKEAFEAVLERLAREKLTERITEIESGKQARLDEQLSEWRDRLNESIAEAELQLESTSSSRARGHLEKRVATLRSELAAEDEKRVELEETLDAELESEVDEALAEAYAEVLDTAASEAGFTVETVGPHRRHPTAYGPIEHLPKAVQVLFHREHLDDLEVGDATGVVEDPTLRTVHFAIVENVEPATVNDLSRREYIDATFNYRRNVLGRAATHSYGRQAFVARLGFTEPGDENIKSN